MPKKISTPMATIIASAGLAYGPVVDYPGEAESLHPMAGMKRVHTLDGTERRFELSEAAKRRHELKKRAETVNRKKQSFRKRDKIVIDPETYRVFMRGTSKAAMREAVSRGTKS